MSAQQQNALLAAEHPAAAALLSPLGRRAAMPLGIPQQAEQARNCVRKATIGEITHGDGTPMALPSVARHFVGLDLRTTFRYAPQAGLPALRAAWARQIALEDEAPMSLPVVTTGITHGLSLCADLFTGPDVPVIVATPYWDNYDTIFTMRTGAPLRTFPFYDARDGFDVASLAATLRGVDGPATLLLNFPANPTGYAPTRDEAQAIATVIAAHPGPLVVVCDDAYHGLVFEPDVYPKSLFGLLARTVDPKRTLVVRVDGATKELVFFGGRVGFITFSAGGSAGEVLAEKAAAIIRATISSSSAPAQAAVIAALQSPTLAAEQAEVKDVLTRRYRALRTALAAHGIRPRPFNAGCFALVPLPDGMDCEVVRHRLIVEQSVGTIAVPSANALRVAFCSMEEADLEDLVARIARVIG
jgi:aspartate/methionine/tyrosine aminotransferase